MIIYLQTLEIGTKQLGVLAFANSNRFQIVRFSYFSYDLLLYNYFEQLILQSWACLVPCSCRGPDGIQVEALLQRPRRRMESCDISQKLRQQKAHSHYH